jgi:branched-subunit amino acid permease
MIPPNLNLVKKLEIKFLFTAVMSILEKTSATLIKKNREDEIPLSREDLFWILGTSALVVLK